MTEIIYHKATIADISILIENRILFSIKICGTNPINEIENLKFDSSPISLNAKNERVFNFFNN